jgi:hypothetical protein
VIFAILGIFVGIILGVIIIGKIIKRHTNKLWLRQQTKKYIVKDFQGRITELKNITTRHPMDNDRTEIKPSAPVQSST